jgi:2-C-methyl-D-erythritol 2,4-cyclodiphosphate synthase
MTDLRVGIGHDTHRLVSGGPLRLGGVDIAFDKHLLGHSDADVLLHAITDAILGAAAMGDIGDHFPDTQIENKNRSSIEMLKWAADLARRSDFDIVNVDCIIFAEKPKLSPSKPLIAQSIARILDLDVSRVNVKAKTGEAIGSVGTQECMMAQCVALLRQNQ